MLSRRFLAAAGGEAFGLGGGVGFDAAAHEFAELKKGLVGDGVDDVVALAAAFHEAAAEHDAEVFRDVALLEAGALDELADVGRAGHEGAQEDEAGGLGEEAEVAGRFGDLEIGHGGLGFFRLHIAVS